MDPLSALLNWSLSAISLLFRQTPTFLAYANVPLNFETAQIIVGWFALRAIIAAPIAYFAKCKGYSWWGFFLVAWMFMPAASIAMILALPKLKNGKVVPSK